MEPILCDKIWFIAFAGDYVKTDRMQLSLMACGSILIGFRRLIVGLLAV